MKHWGHGDHCPDGGCLILKFIAERDAARAERDKATAALDAVRAVVRNKAFGVAVPGARTANHNGAHDVVMVSDVNAALAQADTGETGVKS